MIIDYLVIEKCVKKRKKKGGDKKGFSPGVCY